MISKFLSALFLSGGWLQVEGCVTPVGLCVDKTTDTDCVFELSELSTLPFGDMFVQSFVVFNNLYGNHDDLYETAIQFRQTSLSGIRRWNTQAAFEINALDFFAREDVTLERRRCQPDPMDENAVEMFNFQQQVSFAYALLFVYVYDKPTRLDQFVNNLFITWGLDPNICDNGIKCNNVNTPWGLAYTVSLEIEDIKTRDGWNELGDYNREYNRIPWSDFRDENNRYEPVNDPWNLDFIDRWQPLTESDEYGFVYYQQHSVPHIGYSGLSYHHTNEEICDATNSLPDPEYDYNIEIPLAIERLRNLTDLQKAEIEFYDVKENLILLVGSLLLPGGGSADSFEFTKINLIILHSFYEAGLLAWKTKVDFDKVRPTSIVHELIPDEVITSYAGVSPEGESFGTQTYFAKDWEPYIRTMPHAEYPSGSSCVCEAFAEAMREYFGTDDLTQISPFGAQFLFPAFSSKKEPLSTPAENILLLYFTFSEISESCGQSRLDGGMHFTASVPNGANLCRNVGTRVTSNFVNLANGIQPEYSIDFDTAAYTIRDCGDDSDSDSSSSSSSSSSRRKSKGRRKSRGRSKSSSDER